MARSEKMEAEARAAFCADLAEAVERHLEAFRKTRM
jgi:hypothetical protein